MKRFQPVKCLLLLALAACAPKADNHGYVTAEDWKEKVTAGQTTKDQILSTFGSPSAQNNFGSETWYYITSRQETTAFLRPKVVEQDVVRIEFDQAGVVSQVEMFDKSNAKKFALVRRTTPTEGHSMGVVEQLLGNIGRFNSPGGKGGSAAPGGRGY